MVRAVYVLRADDFGVAQLCQSNTITVECSVYVHGVILGENLGTVPLDYPPRFQCLIDHLDPDSVILAADIAAGVKAYLLTCGVPFGEDDVDTVRLIP